MIGWWAMPAHRRSVAYSPNRQGGHPQDHLKSFQEILQADAFAGFGALYAWDGIILEPACRAHARCKFFENHQAQGSPIAAEALKRIAAAGITNGMKSPPIASLS
jgi:hypothetical protein